ncbi:MAG: hypothetical protein C0467_04895 [Planctomycetaceae bacterium]|nr:hypothetical protein [Planctomycetaceae bacterium]
MSEANNRPAPDPLDLATDVLRGAPVPAGPPAELVAATIAAVRDRLAGAVPAEALARKRRRRIMSYVGFGTATAAAVAVAVVMWSPARSEAGMFEKAIEKVEKAKSFRAKFTISGDGNNKLEMKVSARGGKVRIEQDLGGNMGPVVILGDFAKKTSLVLLRNNKLAMWSDDPAETLPLPEAITKRLAGADVPTLVDALTELKGAKYETLPDEVVEGHKAKVFVVKGFKWEEGEQSDITLWIEPKAATILKFRLETTTGKSKGFIQEGILLGLDEELDEGQFELKVPAGYQEVGKPEKE